MRFLLALALVALLGLAAAQTPGDPCAFGEVTSGAGVWLVSRAAVLNCFNSVSFNSANRNALVKILTYTWEGFSFGDYLAQPIAPYNVQANLGPQITAAGSKSYNSDYAMHADFMAMYQTLLDAHTTYYMPSGFGAVYYVTPFAIKSTVVGSTQKFYTGMPPYPLSYYTTVCGVSCPYNDTMEGWEISQINGQDVPAFIKTYSRTGGTYYDDGVRANSFIAGSIWGQTSLTIANMPDATFNVTLINPGDSTSTTITLPFAFGGSYTGWSRAAMINANAYQSNKRSAELFIERQLLDTLQEKAAALKLRRDDAAATKQLQVVEALYAELVLNLERIHVDTQLTEALLRRDGIRAADENRLPFIPSYRERLEDVFRMQQQLWALERAPQAPTEFKISAKSRAAALAAAGAKKSASAAVELAVQAGDASQWSLYTSVSSSVANAFEGLTAYYGSYRSTTVLRLRTFSATDGIWVQSVRNAVTQRTTRSLNENLIIDVTNNGGGSICLNYGTMSYLVKAWEDLTQIAGSDVVYSLYDIKRSPLLTQLYNNGDLDYTDAYNATNGAFLSFSYYLNPTTRTIGGKTSSYTQGFQWNPCGTSNGYFSASTYNFNKIVVLTDGRCGSSCAYFITQLRENNKVRVVSYGGIYGEPLATSSFAGGNVYTWDYIRTTWTGAPANPYSSYVAFNVRANYSPGKYPATPRQFDRLEADYYIPMWDSLWRFYNAENYNTTARFALYESLLPVFNEMPAALSRTAASPSYTQAPSYVADRPTPNAAAIFGLSSALLALATIAVAILL